MNPSLARSFRLIVSTLLGLVAVLGLHAAESGTGAIAGVVSIDGITDLAGYAGTSGCNAAVPQLMGGKPPQQLERYALMSPSELVPLRVRSRIVQGTLDVTVPMSQATSFVAKAAAAGDDSQLVLLDHSAHFDPVAPISADWPAVLNAIRSMSRGH